LSNTREKAHTLLVQIIKPKNPMSWGFSLFQTLEG
jgi:hypothetical protein